MELIQGTLVALSVFSIFCQRAMAETGSVIRNGTVWYDTNGDEIWCNGGHIIRKGDVFYWVGYETRPGQRQWNTRLYSSMNFVDWKFENNILTKEGKFAILGWAGRPGLVYNHATRRYVLIFEADSRDWHRHKVGFAICDTINGNYQFERYQYPEEERSTGDQSVYQEGDDAYLVTVLDHPDQKLPNYSLAIFKLSSDFLSIERKIFEGFENGGREAPHIIKIGDTYYWFTSGLKGWNSTATMYSTANSLSGPWAELKTLSTVPDSPDSFNTQHDFVLPVAGNEETIYLYVGDRYSQHHGKGTGRNIFLPLAWEDGVPKLKWYESWKMDLDTGKYNVVASSPVSGAVDSSAEFTFPPKLSADGRYLVDQKEKPFLVIGDSPWSLIVQLTPDQIDQYLDNRQSKGFTLLLVNLIEHKFASDPPRLRNGTPPFHTPGDFATPNDNYFTYAEEVVGKAAERGLIILLCPAYLGFGGGDQGFYQEMLKSGPEKVREYGRYVGRRFREHPNLIWIIGGDFNPPSENKWVSNELAAGIREEDTVHLMTAHCGPNGVAMAIYGDQSWLQLNNVYDYRMDLYAPCLAEDARQPKMPYFLLETAYEGEHNATPDRIRRQAYWPLLCGAFGQLYGNSPMWHFASVGVYDRGGDWVTALDSQGARDMGHLVSLLRSLPWWLLRADHKHKVVTSGFGTFGQPDYVTTARTIDGAQALSYIPSTGTDGRELLVDLSQFIGEVTARWFNPVYGNYTHIPGSPFPNTGIQVFTTPGDNGTGTNDWLLLLEVK